MGVPKAQFSISTLVFNIGCENHSMNAFRWKNTSVIFYLINTCVCFPHVHDIFAEENGSILYLCIHMNFFSNICVQVVEKILAFVLAEAHIR